MPSQPSATLTIVQARVVKALGQGATFVGAAAAACTDCCSVYDWLENYKDFADAVRQARAAYSGTLNDRSCDLSTIPAVTLRALLDDSQTSLEVRGIVAFTILDRTDPHPSAGESDNSDTSDSSSIKNILRAGSQPPESDTSDTSDTDNFQVDA